MYLLNGNGTKVQQVDQKASTNKTKTKGLNPERRGLLNHPRDPQGRKNSDVTHELDTYQKTLVSDLKV